MFNFNDISHQWINSYQKKISFYDKQQWERSLEDHIISRAENICGPNHLSSMQGNANKCDSKSHSQHCNCQLPNNQLPNDTFPNSIKNDLIDLDLISGAAYTMKSKSQQGWLSSFVHAILRVLFLPFYLKWLSERTSPRLTILLLVLYILQVTALRFYYNRGITSFKIQDLPSAFNGNATNSSTITKSTNEFSEVPATEVLMPIAMMFVIGMIHTQIVGTKGSNSLHLSITNTKKSHYVNNANKLTSNNCCKSTSQNFKETESIYQIRHTECSSSPLSSTTCSAESSPASSVAPINNRFRNRQSNPLITFLDDDNGNRQPKTGFVAKKERNHLEPKLFQKQNRANDKSIPRIKIHDEHKMREIILIDDNHVISDDDNGGNSVELNRRKICSKQMVNKSCSLSRPRRYSDSKNSYSHLLNDSNCAQLEKTPRRFSESNSSTLFANYSRNKFAKASNENASCLRRRSLLKTKRYRKQYNNSHFELPWTSGDNHLSLSPDAINSSFKGFGYYGSSYDSEGTISPITPIASLPGDDWPMINSDANSSDDEEENNYTDNSKQGVFVFDQYQCSSQKQSRQQRQQRQTLDKPTKLFDSVRNKPKVSSYNAEPSSASVAQEKPLSSSSVLGPNYVSYQAHHYSAKKTTNSSNNDYLSSAHGFQQPPDTILSNELKVSCSVWQHNVCQKKDLSVMDISSSIIRKVESIEHSSEYIYLGILFSVTIAIIPTIFRMQYFLTSNSSANHQLSPVSNFLNAFNHSSSSSSTSDLIQVDLFGLLNLFLDDNLFFSKSFRVRCVVAIVMFERFVLSLLYFFLLCVAERTFKQRFLYSKYFSQITRRDRAKRSQVPHFRLHKVRNLKVWLSVRSYLRRHGPHRSVDTICSTSFIIAVCLLTCISLQMLKESSDTTTARLLSWEMVFWSLALGVYIMRLMILGSRINQKYRSNLSVLITEQINLYLQLERKPHKKDALMLANHVLKLAVDLLKELESPYKISGFSANPYLYNITKVVVLSAFSAVLTEMLGFKLKLYKIKLIR